MERFGAPQYLEAEHLQSGDYDEAAAAAAEDLFPTSTSDGEEPQPNLSIMGDQPGGPRRSAPDNRPQSTTAAPPGQNNDDSNLGSSLGSGTVSNTSNRLISLRMQAPQRTADTTAAAALRYQKSRSAADADVQKMQMASAWGLINEEDSADSVEHNGSESSGEKNRTRHRSSKKN